MSNWTLTCAQCGTWTYTLYESIHGPLCPQCAHRQNEHDQPGYGLTPSTYGFTDETE